MGSTSRAWAIVAISIAATPLSCRGLLGIHELSYDSDATTDASTDSAVDASIAADSTAGEEMGTSEADGASEANLDASGPTGQWARGYLVVVAQGMSQRSWSSPDRLSTSRSKLPGASWGRSRRMLPERCTPAKPVA